MIGLPSAGKSTFLAALWHVVDSYEIPGSLERGELIGNREYIEKLRECWLVCEPIQRTTRESGDTVHAQVKKNDEIIDLFFPDMAGEIFEEHWRDRRWMPSYVTMTESVTGLLLFIHPDTSYKPVLIPDLDDIIKDIEEDDVKLKEDDIEEYHPDKACNQSKIVEMIQFHQIQLNNASPLKIAVIISAWDTIESASSSENIPVTPLTYLDKNEKPNLGY
jgi:hypothetical protein